MAVGEQLRETVVAVDILEVLGILLLECKSGVEIISDSALKSIFNPAAPGCNLFFANDL